MILSVRNGISLFAASITVALVPAFTAFSQEEKKQLTQAIRVTPQARIEYGEVVSTQIDAKKLQGLTAVGVRPAGEAYMLMGQLVPRGSKTELRFILEKGTKGESQDFEVILERPAVGLPEVFNVKQDPAGIDILYNKQGVALKLTRLMTQDPIKVFSHVFDTKGVMEITNGGAPKSAFPHHRGIFLGWSKTGFNGKTYDTWHMKDGVNQKFERLVTKNIGPMYCDHTAQISWNTGDGQTILDEKRTIRGLHPTNKGYGMMEVDTVLSASHGDVVLDGDPEHAGCQFRASNQTAVIAKNVMDGKAPQFQKTKYFFHEEGVDPKADKDLPWVTMGFSIGEERFFVQHMSHPDNPRGYVYSAYRPYGRFGAFGTHTIKKGESLRLRYRFVFGIGKVPSAEFMQATYDAFATPPKVELIDGPVAPPTEKPEQKLPDKSGQATR